MKSRVFCYFIFSLCLIIVPGIKVSAEVSPPTFIYDLYLNSTGPDVLTLQRLLNTDQDTLVAVTGVGSKGNETSYFGPATKAGVIKFQTKYGIVPAQGYVGEETRNKLNSIYSQGLSSGTASATSSPQTNPIATSTIILTTPVNPTTTREVTFPELVEILISVGAIAPEKATLARSIAQSGSTVSTGASVDLKINGVDSAITVNSGTPLYLSWTSRGVTSCTSSSLSKPISGSQTVYASQTGTYSISCTGPAGSVGDSVQVSVTTQNNNSNTSNSGSNSWNSGVVNPNWNSGTTNSSNTNSNTSSNTNSNSYDNPYSYSYSNSISNIFSGMASEAVDPVGPLIAPDSYNRRVVRGDITQGPGGIRCADRSIDIFGGSYDDGVRTGKGIGSDSRVYGPSIRLVAEDPASVLSTATKTYMVIDVSSGTSTNSYLVSFLDSAPSDLLTNTIYKTTKIVMRKAPAGTFTMGSPDLEPGRRTWKPTDPFKVQGGGNDNDEFLHTVTLTKNFYVSIFEITQKQYERVTGAYNLQNKQNLQGATQVLTDSMPLLSVTWETARGGTWPNGQPTSVFMTNLKNKTGGIKFDLPTEAQWEYACRAGTNTGLNSGKELEVSGGIDASNLYPSVNADEVSIRYNGYYQSNWGEVGLRKANNWGIYDMHGNAPEWTLDWYSKLPGDNGLYPPAGGSLASTSAEEEDPVVRVDFSGTVTSVLNCYDENGSPRDRFTQIIVSPCDASSPVIDRAYEYQSSTRQELGEVNGTQYGEGSSDPVMFLYDSVDGYPKPTVGQTILGIANTRATDATEKCPRTSPAGSPSGVPAGTRTSGWLQEYEVGNGTCTATNTNSSGGSTGFWDKVSNFLGF